MPTKLVLQQRGASGLNTAAELPTLENGKVNIGLLPVVGEMGAAIVERGDNANGEYIRWADGTQICRSTIELTGLNVVQDEAIWNSTSYTPPAAFVGNYDISVTCIQTTNNDSGGTGLSFIGYVGHRHGFVLYNTGGSYYHVAPGSAVRNGGSYKVIAATINVLAIGRWK